jgi:adenosylcobinamide kinase/adenosylcobinamide-phosphate guanylyltransferase
MGTLAGQTTNVDSAHRELILGGQRSGKSQRAEALVGAWLGGGAGRSAVLIATALAGDEEMQRRIERHRQDRARRLPQLLTCEEPKDIAALVWQHSRPDCMVVVDCLTVWLGNWLMPLQGASAAPPMEDLARAVSHACGPVVLVSNEIGLGVIPLGSEVRGFVDGLGRLNQNLARICNHVTLMVAGLPLVVKPSPNLERVEAGPRQSMDRENG